MAMLEVLVDFDLAGKPYVASSLVPVEDFGGQVKYLLAMGFVLPYVPGEELAEEPPDEELIEEEG